MKRSDFCQSKSADETSLFLNLSPQPLPLNDINPKLGDFSLTDHNSKVDQNDEGNKEDDIFYERNLFNSPSKESTGIDLNLSGSFSPNRLSLKVRKE